MSLRRAAGTWPAGTDLPGDAPGGRRALTSREASGRRLVIVPVRLRLVAARTREPPDDKLADEMVQALAMPPDRKERPG
jgi:hypothetical protein